MKIRIGFISNSSSSSFIVIKDSNFQLPKSKPFNLPSKKGEVEFGWQNKKYNDFYSKLNFACLQLRELRRLQKHFNKKRKEMPINYFKYDFNKIKQNLKEILTKHKIEIKNFDYFFEEENNNYYIDHASSIDEDRNMEIFENKEKLETFLFCQDSYIQNQNDNQ